MTNETLQQKIDTIERKFFIDDEYSQHQTILDVNKALQELREQIKKLDTMTPIGFKNEYVDVKDVLALLGEKK